MDDRINNLKKWLGRSVHVIIDRPIGHQHKNMIYPLNYGYIPGIPGGDGEDQDAYILGVDQPITEFHGQVIGIVHRRNDCEDKLVVAPAGYRYHRDQIAEAVHFQEQFFDTRILSCLIHEGI